MKLIRYSGALEEQEAFEFHAKYFRKHIFIINDIEEYWRLRPVILMFPRSRVKLVLRNGLTQDKIKKSIRSKYDKDKYMRDGKKKVKVEEKIETVNVTPSKTYSKKNHLYSSVRIGSSKTARLFRNHKPAIYRK